MPDPFVLTPLEVAERLRIAKNTVYELIKRGELKAYRVGKKVRVDSREIEAYRNRGSSPQPLVQVPAADLNRQGFVISGQDALLDILVHKLSEGSSGFPVLRSQLGSYNGLFALYRDEVDAATAHLWDAASDQYNLSFVRAMLPGIPAVLVHLARRPVGFYVAQGNPLNITSWDDWARPSVRPAFREWGSGMRVLIDQKCRGLAQGQELVAPSHVAAAIAVARGDADVSVGTGKAAEQVKGVEFVFTHYEHYDLVLKASRENEPRMLRLLEVIRSAEFRKDTEALGDYDLERLGQESGRT